MEWTQKKPVGGSKYGLQLKIAAPTAKKTQLKKPLPFSLDDQNEYTVEDDIARQASKKQFAHEVDEQIKEALEQDASAFDYDGVYDQMKGKQAQPIREDRAKRESKYIGKLLEKSKVRAVENDMAFERRLTKERQKDDHLYGDKETFVTGAYKKKLIEQGKWQEEERLRDLREEAHEVSGKKDLSDFYRNLLQNNVAFGAARDTGSEVQHEIKTDTQDPVKEELVASSTGRRSDDDDSEPGSPVGPAPPRNQDAAQSTENSGRESIGVIPGNFAEEAHAVRKEQSATEGPTDGEMPASARASSLSKEDAVAAARERYLARKRQRKD